ncbi:MAG: NAD-dependent epimerase/dehydratase family protein [Alphaproteobacteria bacterium]|nr:NAD-dependent epimerase/dehydratase family protein [Alphaproteobacteria bacterium]
MNVRGLVLVTGATGFVGRAVCPVLSAGGWSVRAAVRRQATLPNIETVPVGEVGPDTDWQAALAGCRTVVHLAAQVHQPGVHAATAEAAFQSINAAGTERLAVQAAAAGVERLVLVSTIKVLGEATTECAPFTDQSTPDPQDAYARSKWAAEQALRRVAAEAGMAAVILRPPLVYGPGVKGNMAALLRLADSPWPLPFGALHNRRSLLALENLCRAIALGLETPALSGAFVLADRHAVSTCELVRALRAGLGRPARLLPMPPGLLRWSAAALGRSGLAERLAGDLLVDARGFAQATGWAPNPDPLGALAEMARLWREARAS